MRTERIGGDAVGQAVRRDGGLDSMMRSQITTSRRDFMRAMAAGAAVAALPNWLLAAGQEADASRPPNFVIVFADDLGYGDLGCFGAPRIKTPNLDRMAAEGVRLTDFYSAAPVCTPSRASLMTGCYPLRVGMPAVVYPSSRTGIADSEVTVAELLKTRGYATACVGKWHLGWQKKFLPTRHGFDEYFGIPYSNDMKPSPLIRGEETVEEPAEQDTLTQRYTEESIRFITASKDKPFFLYLAHNMPHVPLHAGEKFRGRSAEGLYGDVIEELDWSVGQVLDTLGRLRLDGRTLVLFTSDNGPWLTMGKRGGTARPLRGGKGACYEGGMREPCIARWVGHVPAGTVCKEVATTMDILPTLAGLAGAKPPADRTIDGRDISPLLAGANDARSPHEAFFYYCAGRLDAVRSGSWKLVYPFPDFYGRAAQSGTASGAPALYDLETDIGETRDVAADHPEEVKRLTALVEKCREDLGDSRTGQKGKNLRPCGHV